MTALKVTKSKAPERAQLQPMQKVILATQNLQTIQSACKVAVQYKRLIGLCGEPGLGKTVALKFFKKQNNNVFFITVKPSMKAKTFWLELMQMVCSTEKQRQPFYLYEQRSLYFILKKICQRFNEIENPLLIIDEAGKLTDKMLLNVHELRDETMNNLGIVIAGPKYFKENLHHWAARNKQGIPELVTRINSWVELERPTNYEFKKICEEYGITDNEVIKALSLKADNYRSLHNRITEFIIENSH